MGLLNKLQGKGAPGEVDEVVVELVGEADYKAMNKVGRKFVGDLARDNNRLRESNEKLSQELNELKANYREYKLDRESQIEELEGSLREMETAYQDMEVRYKEEKNWHFILKECEKLAEEKARALEKELETQRKYHDVNKQQKVVLKEVVVVQREEIRRLQGWSKGDTLDVASTLDRLAQEVADLEAKADNAVKSSVKRGVYDAASSQAGIQSLDRVALDMNNCLERLREIRATIEDALQEPPEPSTPVAPPSPPPQPQPQPAPKPEEPEPPTPSLPTQQLGPITDAEVAQLIKNKDLHIEVLMKQVRSLGVEPVSEVLSLEDAKGRVFEAMRKLNEGDEKAERDLDKWLAFIKNHPETIAAERKQNDEFVQQQKAANDAALHLTRTMVPPDIWLTTLHDLKGRGLPNAVAERVWRKRALWLTRYPPDKIARMHLGLLRSKFGFEGLDLTELRAVFMCLPKKFEADPKREKEQWAQDLLGLLQLSIAKEEKGELAKDKRRAVCYRELPRGPFDPDAPPQLPEVRESLQTREKDLQEELEICRRRTTSLSSLLQPTTEEEKSKPVHKRAPSEPKLVNGNASSTAPTPNPPARGGLLGLLSTNSAPSVTTSTTVTTEEAATRKWWQPTIRAAPSTFTSPDAKSSKPQLPPSDPSPEPQKPSQAPKAGATKPNPVDEQSPPATTANTIQAPRISVPRSFMDEIKSKAQSKAAS